VALKLGRAEYTLIEKVGSVVAISSLSQDLTMLRLAGPRYLLYRLAHQWQGRLGQRALSVRQLGCWWTTVSSRWDWKQRSFY